MGVKYIYYKRLEKGNKMKKAKTIFNKGKILVLCLAVAFAMVPAFAGCGSNTASGTSQDISIYDNTAWMSDEPEGAETWIVDGGQTLEVKIDGGKFNFAYADYCEPEGDNWRTKIIDSVDLSELKDDSIVYHFNDIGGYEGTIKFTMEGSCIVVKVNNGNKINDNPSEKALSEGSFKLNAYKGGDIDEFVKDSVKVYKYGPDAVTKDDKNSKDEDKDNENKNDDGVDPIEGYGDSDMDVDSHDSFSLSDAKEAAYKAAKSKAAGMEIESWVKNGKNDIWVEYETHDAYLIEVAVYSKLEDGTEFSDGGYVFWYNKYTGIIKYVNFSSEGGAIFVENGSLNMDTGEYKG